MRVEGFGECLAHAGRERAVRPLARHQVVPVRGVDLSVSGFGFRFQVPGGRVEGLGLRVYGMWYMVCGIVYMVNDIWYMV